MDHVFRFMKLAAHLSADTAHSTAAVAAMLTAQSARPWHTRQLASGAAGAIGTVSTADRFSATASRYESGVTGNQLFVTGIPVLAGSSAGACLQQIVELSPTAAAEKLAQMDGAFAALLWNPLERWCVVVTDALGMQPLYMVRRPGVLAMASEAKALTAAGVVDYAMSAAGWGAFLSFRHPIAGLTLAESVHRVPAGSILSFDLRTDHLSCRSHTPWPEARDPRDIDAPFVEELIDALLEDIRAYQAHHANPTLFLSGGYDSRLLLAALAEIGRHPPVVIHDHADELFGLESRLAARVAKAFGAPFQRLHTGRDYFSSTGYVDYLVASDVGLPSLYLFIAQMGAALPSGIEAVWEGTFPGCLLVPVHQPPGGFDAYLARECASTDSLWWRAAERVFARDALAQMRSAFQESLASERARYADTEHGVSEFVVRNRTRQRIAINALQVYANDVLPLTPGLTQAFWRRAASVPYSLKARHAFYQQLFRRFFPGAMRVPVVSGGRFDRLDSRGAWAALAGTIAAQLQRPRPKSLLRRAGMRSGGAYWMPSRLIDEAVQETRATDGDLNAAGVALLQRRSPPYDDLTNTARALLFYRFAAHQIFIGALRYPRRGIAEPIVRVTGRTLSG
jgi:asparagine synthase (glutamine-hydrolysing)